MSNQNDLLAEAEAIGTRIREAVRQGHELLRDLRSATREARDVLATLDQRIHDGIDKQIGAEVDAGLEAYKASLATAIDKAEAKVLARFDGLAAILMGEDPKSRRQGIPTLTELAERRAVEPRG